MFSLYSSLNDKGQIVKSSQPFILNSECITLHYHLSSIIIAHSIMMDIEADDSPVKQGGV